MRDKKILLYISTIPVLFFATYGQRNEGVIKNGKDHSCPNKWEISKLRGEFVSILHLIEKQEIAQETGWTKFGKFLTFLSPKKRIETVDDFCQKINSERDQPKQRWFRKVKSSNYEECLNKIFWSGNAELVRLKKGANLFTGLIYNMYNENAKMFEGMLKPRAQLITELIHHTLNPSGRGAQVDIDVLTELLVGRSKEELGAVIEKYNETFKNRRNLLKDTQLLVDLKNISRKLPENSPKKFTYGILEEKIGKIAQQNNASINWHRFVKELIGAIFNTCEKWQIWEELCCDKQQKHCEKCQSASLKLEEKPYAWYGEQLVQEIKKTNNLFREILVYAKYDQALDKNFARTFSNKCAPFIFYMHHPERSKRLHQIHLEKVSPAKKNLWFRKSKRQEVKNNNNNNVEEIEIVPRQNFAQIEKMMQIAGLNEDGSQFKHLAQKLKEANLSGNYKAVQRIVDLHVGVDMLKILDNYAEGFSGVLKDLSAKNGQATTFNAMFTTAYLNILSSLSNKCYVSIEEGPFGRRIGSIIIGGPDVKKRVRFSMFNEEDQKLTLAKDALPINKIEEQPHNEDETENDEQSEDGQEEELENISSKPLVDRHNFEKEFQNTSSKPIIDQHNTKLSPPESSRKRYQLLLDEKGPQILERLNNLMEAIKRRKTELIRDQENGLMPEDHGKALLQNCEVDDELFNKFLYGTDIEHELLSKGGPNSLHTIYNSLEKRRNKMIEKRPSLVKMKPNVSIKINGSEQDSDLMHIAKNLRPIKTSKNLPNEKTKKVDKPHKKDNSPNRGINSPTKMPKIDHYISPKLVSSPSKKLINSPSKVKIKQTDKLPKWDTWPNNGIISSPKTTVINNVKLPKWNTWPETDSNGPRNAVPNVDNVPKLDNSPKQGINNPLMTRAINSDNVPKLDNSIKQGINSPPKEGTVKNDNAQKLNSSPDKGKNVQIRVVEENPKIPQNMQNNSNSNNDNNERNLLKELDDLINLIKNARDNFTHAEVELGVASAFKHKTNDIDCWINDAKFKQFLDGQPIAIDLLPRGDANNMQYILDSLLQRREHFINENLGKGKLENKNDHNLIKRMDSVIRHVNKARKFLKKAEGGSSEKTRAHSYITEKKMNQIFKKILNGENVMPILLPKGGSSCLEGYLDNLIKRRELMRYGGEGLLEGQQQQQNEENSDDNAQKHLQNGDNYYSKPYDKYSNSHGKYGKSKSLPTNGDGKKQAIENENEYSKSRSMPTTGAEYEEKEKSDQKRDPTTWMDTAREWSGWMANKLGNIYSWNKAETPAAEQSSPNQKTKSLKMVKQNSSPKREEINHLNGSPKKQNSPKNNTVLVQHNKNKISPPQNPKTPSPVPNQRPIITISPDLPSKNSTPNSPKKGGKISAQPAHSTVPGPKNAEKIVPTMAKSKSLGKQNDVKTKNDLKHSDANDGDSDDEHVQLLSTSVRDLAGNFDLLRLGKITDNIINKKHDVQLRPVVDTSRKGRNLQRNNAAGSTSRKSVSPSRTAAPPPPPPPAPTSRKN